MNEDTQLPDDVRAFVLKHIDSVAQLEALLLTRSAADQPWTVPELASRLYVTEAEAASVVRALHRRGLLAQEDDAFRYQPRHDELRRDVDALAAAYPRFLIPLTKLIHSKPSVSLRDFADAFRLREEK
jgi:hypothetical protein